MAFSLVWQNIVSYFVLPGKKGIMSFQALYTYVLWKVDFKKYKCIKEKHIYSKRIMKTRKHQKAAAKYVK